MDAMDREWASLQDRQAQHDRADVDSLRRELDAVQRDVDRLRITLMATRAGALLACAAAIMGWFVAVLMLIKVMPYAPH